MSEATEPAFGATEKEGTSCSSFKPKFDRNPFLLDGMPKYVGILAFSLAT